MLECRRAKRFIINPINFGVSDELTSLNAIRYKFINAFNFLLIGFAFILGIRDIYEGEIISLYLNLITLTFWLLSVYFSYNKRTERAILITCTVLNLLCFTVCYIQFLEAIEIIPQILFTVSFTLFLLPGGKIRLIYIGLCAFFLTLIVLKYDYKTEKAFLTLFQVIVCIYAQNLFMLFVESQDRKLNDNVSELERSNINEAKLNELLQYKNEEVVAYSNIMTHDLKAPLRNIISFLGLVKKYEDKDSQKTRQFLTHIDSSALSMNSLINNLLQYSKVGNQAIKIEDVDLQVVVNEVISNFKYETDNGNLKFECSKLPVINGDKQLLKILFQNFISNSIKYQPKNREGHIPTLKILAESNVQYDNILIIDNGIGIEEEYIDELFMPFKRFQSSVEYEGTGLGMSICKRIIQQLNGEIKLLETSENGTTFQLSFNKSLKKIV